MLNYVVHLKTVNDFRNFENLTVKFHIRGYVKTEDYYADMYCLLDIMSHCPVDKMNLVLTKYNEEEATAIETYLYQTGLLEGRGCQRRDYGKIA